MRVSLPTALIRGFLLAATLASPAMLAGCSANPTDPEAAADASDVNDPIEPTNRLFYRINDGLDTVILRPAAVAYNYILPPTVREHTHNFLVNLSDPVTLADDMLQGKPRRAGDTLMRLLINSTVGVAGVFDVATDWGYPAHSTDFGVTLALWGFDAGPYLFLPLFGPSDPRDAVGIGADVALDPLTWVGKGAAVTGLEAGRFAVNAIDTRAGLIGTIDQIKAGALDPYATFRSLYRQHREPVGPSCRHVAASCSPPPPWASSWRCRASARRNRRAPRISSRKPASSWSGWSTATRRPHRSRRS